MSVILLSENQTKYDRTLFPSRVMYKQLIYLPTHLHCLFFGSLLFLRTVLSHYEQLLYSNHFQENFHTKHLSRDTLQSY